VSEIIGLSRLLPDCIFQHAGREVNRVAHRLARRAQEKKEWIVMRHDTPSDAHSLVQAEAARDLLNPSICNTLH
jgi:hypothetical protein